MPLAPWEGEECGQEGPQVGTSLAIQAEARSGTRRSIGTEPLAWSARVRARWSDSIEDTHFQHSRRPDHRKYPLQFSPAQVVSSIEPDFCGRLVSAIWRAHAASATGRADFS